MTSKSLFPVQLTVKAIPQDWRFMGPDTWLSPDGSFWRYMDGQPAFTFGKFIEGLNDHLFEFKVSA